MFKEGLCTHVDISFNPRCIAMVANGFITMTMVAKHVVAVGVMIMQYMIYVAFWCDKVVWLVGTGYVTFCHLSQRSRKMVSNSG